MMMSERKVISLMDVQMAYNAAHFASFYVNHSCYTQQWNGGKQHLMTIFIAYNNLVKESSDEEKLLS